MIPIQFWEYFVTIIISPSEPFAVEQSTAPLLRIVCNCVMQWKSRSARSRQSMLWLRWCNERVFDFNSIETQKDCVISLLPPFSAEKCIALTAVGHELKWLVQCYIFWSKWEDNGHWWQVTKLYGIFASSSKNKDKPNLIIRGRIE